VADAALQTAAANITEARCVGCPTTRSLPRNGTDPMNMISVAGRNVFATSS
jgi:hypothetical protein